MARLITEQELTQQAGANRPGPAFLVVQPGVILTPGAQDAARRLGIQILRPGESARTVLRRLAEEVTGGPVRAEDLAQLEAHVMAKTSQ